jgi:hypothetical protein
VVRLFGSDLQQGVSGSGDTPAHGVNDLDAPFQTVERQAL